MDKFEKILDIIDHQEKYSDEEIREILQDEECRKLYQTMMEVDSALESPSPIINVDETDFVALGSLVEVDEDVWHAAVVIVALDVLCAHRQGERAQQEYDGWKSSHNDVAFYLLFYNQLVLLQFDVYILELVQFFYDVLDARMTVPFVIEAEGLVLVILKLHL